MNEQMKKLSEKLQRMQREGEANSKILLLDYARLSISIHEKSETELAAALSNKHTELLDNLVYMQRLGQLIVNHTTR